MNVDSRNILWLNFKNGESGSIPILYKEYADELYSYGIKIVGDIDLVKDCIQDVFIQLIEKRKSLEITPQIHIYLFKSLRNKLFEELRSKNRKKQIVTQISEYDLGYEKNAEQKIIEAEEDSKIKNKIRTSLEQLSDRQKEIIYLKYTEGFNYDEIAEILQIDKASARTLLYRTLKTLKEHLSNNSLILMVLTGRYFKQIRAEN